MVIWTKATSPCLLIFLHVALLYEPSQPFVVLIPKCSVPKATNTSLLVVILSQLWIESTMHHIRAEYFKHYTIYDIAFVMVIVKTNHFIIHNQDCCLKRKTTHLNRKLLRCPVYCTRKLVFCEIRGFLHGSLHILIVNRRILVSYDTIYVCKNQRKSCDHSFV